MAVVVLSKHTHPKAPPNRWATTRPQQCILLLLGVFVFAYFKSSVSVDSNTGSTNINSTNFLSSTKVSSSSSTAKEVQEGDSSTTNNINSAMSMSNINSAIEPGTQVPRHDEASGYSYWLYTPTKYNQTTNNENVNANAKWPLLIFLHGAGESGSNLNDMISIGATGCPPVEIANDTANTVLTTSFIVASPQTNMGWGSSNSASISKLQIFVESLLQSSEDLNVDKTRVYCTGVSMGGGGAWVAGTTQLFAAIAPVCGTQRVNNPSTLDGVHIWAFHGANDMVVPVSVTDYNIDILKKHRKSYDSSANNKENTGDYYDVKYTRYDESPAPVGWEDYEGHASWRQAYEGDELWDWFLTKSK